MYLLLILIINGWQSLPPYEMLGWDQIDIESYHGPQGYFHDAMSGAIVEYYVGHFPSMVGATLTKGVTCKARMIKGYDPACLCSIDSQENAPVRRVHTYIGPINGIYSAYWAEVSNEFQKERAISLMLFNPLWDKATSDKPWRRGDAVDSDFANVKVGMTLYNVISLLGSPLELQGMPDAGFTAEFVIWSKSGSARNWRSHREILEFSQFRILQRIMPPNNSLHRTPPRAASLGRCGRAA
jgi:hypothetical protein